MRRDCAPRKSDDTEVVPPIYYERGAGAPIENLEGDAPSAPIFPARQRGFVGRNEAGLRPAKVGRHGGRPSNIPRTRRGSAYRKPGGRCSVGAHFSRAPARLCRTDGCGASPRISRTTQPRRWEAPRKRLEEGPQGMRSGRRAWQRSPLQGHRRLRSASSPAPPPSTASLRLLLPSDFLLSSGRLVSRTAGQTETEAVVAEVRVVHAEAVGDSAAVRIVAPAAAAEATEGGIFNILAPLPHIPTHVVNT